MRTKKTPMSKKTGSTPKISGLVVAALRNLRDAHGSSPKEIMKYIMAEYNASETTVQRQLKTALKRGVEYGILKKTSGGYSLNTEADVIGPFDLAQMDACGPCGAKPKRRKRKSCPRKKKRKSCRPKRKACPRKKRKRNPCNICATRGRKGDCSGPVQLVRENSPAALDEDDNTASGAEAEKRSVDEQARQTSRSRSTSRQRPRRQRSRSQSEPDFDEDDGDDDNNEE